MEKRVANIASMLGDLHRSATGGLEVDRQGLGTAAGVMGISSADVATLLRSLDEALVKIKGEVFWLRVATLMLDTETGLFVFITHILKKKTGSVTSTRKDQISSASLDGGLKSAAELLNTLLTLARQCLHAQQHIYIVTEIAELLRRTVSVKGVSSFQESLFAPLQQALCAAQALNVPVSALRLTPLITTLLKYAAPVKSQVKAQRSRRHALYFLGFVCQQFGSEIAKSETQNAAILKCFKDNVDSLMSSETPELSVAAGLLEGLGRYFQFQCPDGAGSSPQEKADNAAFLDKVYHVLCRGLDLHNHTRYEVPKAAMALLELHSFVFKRHLRADRKMLTRITTLISHRNSHVTKQALATAGAYAATLSVALCEPGSAEEVGDASTYFRVLFETARTLLGRTDSHSVSLGAVLLGHLLRPAVYFEGLQAARGSEAAARNETARYIYDTLTSRFFELYADTEMLKVVRVNADEATEGVFQDSMPVLARYLPSFIDSMAACIISLPTPLLVATVEQQLSDLLKIVHTHYAKPYVFPSTRLKIAHALLHLLLALYTKGEILSRILSNFMLNAVLQMLASSVVAVEKENDDSNEDGEVPLSAPQSIGFGKDDDDTVDLNDYQNNSHDLSYEVRKSPYLTLWGVLIRSASVQNSGAGYLNQVWGLVLGSINDAGHSHFCALLFDSLMGTLLKIMQSLDLGYSQTEEVEGAEAETLLYAPHIVPSNPADHALLRAMNTFVCGLMGKLSGGSLVSCWHLPFANALLAVRTRRPLLSGIYEMMAALLRKVDWKETATLGAEGGELRSVVIAFIGATMGAVHEAKGELLVAQLDLLLSLDPAMLQMLVTSDLANKATHSGGVTEKLMGCVQLALHTGLSFPPIAELAVAALEKWIAIELNQTQHRLLCAKIVPVLESFISASSSIGAADLPAEEKAKKSKAKAKGLLKTTQNDTKSERERLEEVQIRCLMVLGKLGSGAVAEVLLGDDNAKTEKSADSMDTKDTLQDDTPWDPERRILLRLALGDVKYNLSFDALLPRTCEIALTHTERKVKIAACELLHSIIIWTVGRNAIQPKGEKGASTAPPQAANFTHLNEKLYPVVISLAVDAEPIARQLFGKLLFQLVHWCTRNVHFESVDTMMLLNALVEGLSNSTNGHRRELCANACAEFVKYSIKYGSKSADRNIVSAFTRINSLFSHPDPSRRMGAAKAFSRIVSEIYPHPRYFSALIFPIIQAGILCLSMTEYRSTTLETDAKNGTDISAAASAVPVSTPSCVALLKRCERCVVAKANLLLNQKASSGVNLFALIGAASGSNDSTTQAQTLEAFVRWLIEECFFEEKLTRQWSMRLFLTFVTCLPGYDRHDGPRLWVQKVYHKDNSLNTIFRAIESRLTTLPENVQTITRGDGDVHGAWSSELEAIADAYAWVCTHSLSDLSGLFPSEEARPAKKRRTTTTPIATSSGDPSVLPRHVLFYLNDTLANVAELAKAVPGEGNAGFLTARLKASQRCLESIMYMVLAFFNADLTNSALNDPNSFLTRSLLKTATLMLLRPSRLCYDPHNAATQTQIPALGKKVLKMLQKEDITQIIAEVFEGVYAEQEQASNPGENNLFKQGAIARMLRGDAAEETEEVRTTSAEYRGSQADLVHLVRGCRALQDMAVLNKVVSRLEPDLTTEAQTAAALCSELSHLPVDLLVRPGTTFLLHELCHLCFDLGLAHDELLSLLSDKTPLTVDDLAAGRVSRSFSNFFLGGTSGSALTQGGVKQSAVQVTRCQSFYSAHRTGICDYVLANPPPLSFFERLRTQNPGMFYRFVSDLCALCAVVFMSGKKQGGSVEGSPRMQLALHFASRVGAEGLVPLLIDGVMSPKGAPGGTDDELFLTATTHNTDKNGQIDEDELTHVITILSSLAKVFSANGDTHSALTERVATFSVWVLSRDPTTRLLKKQAGVVKNVCRVIQQLCPHVLTSQHSTDVLIALQRVVSDELPVHYTEVFRDATGGSPSKVQARLTSAYIRVVDALLGCLSESGSVELLRGLFSLFRGSGAHPLADRFSACLLRFFGSLAARDEGVNAVLSSASKCIEVFVDDDIPGDIRCAAVSRVCSLALLKLPAPSVEEFFAEHCVRLYEHLTSEWPSPHALGECISTLITKTSALSLFELMYRLCSPEATKTGINEKFAVLLGKLPGLSQYTGKEMNDKVVRTAYAGVTERLFFEDAVARASYSNVNGAAALLRYRQAAYNCLAAALLATQNNVNMITRALFTPRKNEDLLERIVDLNKEHIFAVETNFSVKEQALYIIPHDWEEDVSRAAEPQTATPSASFVPTSVGTQHISRRGEGDVLQDSSMSLTADKDYGFAGDALAVQLTQSQHVTRVRAKKSDKEEDDAHTVVPIAAKTHRDELLSQMPPPEARSDVTETPKKTTTTTTTPAKTPAATPHSRTAQFTNWSLFSQNPAPPLTPCIDFKFKEEMQKEVAEAKGEDLLEKPESWEKAALARYADGDLEMDEINRSPVMATMLRTVLFLVHKGADAANSDAMIDSDEPPLWMSELLNKAASSRTNLNVRLFVAKIVVNFSDLFQKHAHMWVAPLIEIALLHHRHAVSSLEKEDADRKVKKEDTFGVTYFVRDVVLTLVGWSTTASNMAQVRLNALRDEDDQSAAVAPEGAGVPHCGIEAEAKVAQLIEFLLKNCTHKKRRILRENIELVKLLIAQWGSKVRIGAEHKRIIMGWVCYSEGSDVATSATSSSPWVHARITGLQLLGTLIANGISAYDPFSDASVMTQRDFYGKLLANAPPHPSNRTLPKELVEVVSEVIGMILQQQSLQEKTEALPSMRSTQESSSEQHLHDKVAKKLRLLHGGGHTEQFLLLLGGIVRHYPAIADEFMPHRLLKLVPISRGPYTLLILEIIRKRAEHFPTVYAEFHPFVHDLLLSTGNEAVDIRLNTLEIVKIALLSTTGEKGAFSNNDVNHFISHVSRGIRSRLFVAGVLDVDSKAAVFDLWIRIYDSLGESLDTEARDLLTEYLLHGLHDQTTYIKDKILRFWDDPTRLPATVMHRVERLLVYRDGEGDGSGSSLCAPALGDKWLQYSSILLLFLAHRSPDFRDRYTFFKDPLAECEYNEMKIYSSTAARGTLKGFSSSYAGSLGASQGAEIAGTPGFAGTQAPLSLFASVGRRGENHIMSTVGYVPGMTQTQGLTPGVQTASNFAHYEPRQVTSASLSQTAMLFQPFNVNETQRTSSGPPKGAHMVQRGSGKNRRGSFYVQNVALKKRFQRTTEEQRRSVAALYATKEKAAKIDAAEQKKQAGGAEVQVWRLYREGEVPDIQISPSSMLLPLEALCLYDVEISKLVLSELTSQIYAGLSTPQPSLSNAVLQNSGSNPLSDIPDPHNANAEELDTVFDTTGNVVGQLMDSSIGADPLNPANAVAHKKALRKRVVESFVTLCGKMAQESGVVGFLHSFFLTEANRERFAHTTKGKPVQFLGRHLCRMDPASILNSALLSGNVQTGALLLEQGVVCREERLTLLASEIWTSEQKLQRAQPRAGTTATPTPLVASSNADSDLFGSVQSEVSAKAKPGATPPAALTDAAAAAGTHEERRVDGIVKNKKEEAALLQNLNSTAYDALVELYKHLDNTDAANGVMAGKVLSGTALVGVRAALDNDFDKALTVFNSELEKGHPKQQMLEKEARRCLVSLMRWEELSSLCDSRCPLSGEKVFSPHNREALSQHINAKVHLAVNEASFLGNDGAPSAPLSALLEFVEDRVESSSQNMEVLMSLHQFHHIGMSFFMANDLQTARQYVDMGLNGILKHWGGASRTQRTPHDVNSFLGVLQPLVEMSECLQLVMKRQQQGDGGSIADASLLDSADSLLNLWWERTRDFDGSAQQWALFVNTRRLMLELLHTQFSQSAEERQAGLMGETAAPLVSLPGLYTQRLALTLSAAESLSEKRLYGPSRAFLHEYSTLRGQADAQVDEFGAKMTHLASKQGSEFSSMDVRFTFLAARNTLARAGASASPEKAKKMYDKAAQYVQQEDQRLQLSASAPVAFHSVVGDAMKGVYQSEVLLSEDSSKSAQKASTSFRHAVAKAQSAEEKSAAFEKLGLFVDTLLKAAEAKENSGDDMADTDVDTLVQTLIKSVLGAIITGASYASRLRIPRLLEVLEKHPQHKDVFLRNVKNIDSWLLLPWVNQIVSYIGGPAGDVVVLLLRKIVRKFPQQVYYALSASSAELASISLKNANGCAEKIKKLQRDVRAAVAGEDSASLEEEPAPVILVEAFVHSLEQLHNPDLRLKYYLEELVSSLKELKADHSMLHEVQHRFSLLWNEMYTDLFDPKMQATMNEANLNRKFMLKSREQMTVQVEGAQVPLYSDIERTLKPVVRDASVLLLAKQQRSANAVTFESIQLRVREWTACVKNSWGYAKTVGTVPLATYSDFLSGYNANKGAPLSGGESVVGDYILLPHQPFRYLHTTTPAALPDVVSFAQNVLVLGSIQKPKQLVVRCSDETERSFLVKGGEDLRQDQRIQQLFYMFNSCIKSSDRASGLHIDGYGVIPLSPKVGLVEWVDDCAPLKSLIENRFPKSIGNVQAHPSSRKYHEFITSLSSVSSSDWAGGFRALYGEHGGTDLTAKYAELQGGVQSNYLKASLYALCATHSAFYKHRAQFTQSYAAASVGQWLLGIGDRHLDNFLVDKKRCRVVPIDFGHAFGTATEMLHIPELMPFRLTPQLTSVFEPLGASLLKGGMVKTMDSLRRNKELLMDVLSVFVREPLSTWRRTALKRGKKSSDGTQKVAPVEQNSYANAKLASVGKKLSLVNPYVPAAADLSANVIALHTCLKHKNGLSNAVSILKGREGVNLRRSVPATCRSTAEQIDCLLDMATDPNILCRTYMGWAPLF